MLFIVVFNINHPDYTIARSCDDIKYSIQGEGYLTVQDSSGKYHNTSNFISAFKKQFTFSPGKVAISNVAASL